MRNLFWAICLVLAGPAHAATFQYHLVFEGDAIRELQRPFGEDPCLQGQDCFPTDYRLPFGLFSDLSVGQSTSATVDTDAGTISIADRLLPVTVFGTSPTALQGFGSDEFLSIDADRINFISAGLLSNPAPFCDPARPTAGLPDGFCGYFGYDARFTIASVSEIPLPATGALLLAGLGALGLWRLRRT